MSYSLQRRRSYLSMGMREWPRLLDLAIEYGWKPARTIGSGYYVFNDGSKVTARDAKNMAAALMRARFDIPDEDTLTPKLTKTGKVKRGQKITLLDWFSGHDGQHWVVDVANFLLRGAFEIW